MKFTSINEYVSTLPENAQKAMSEIIAAIKDVVPDAEEHISYNMPAFKVNDEYFVHFSAWKNHIGMYPIPAGMRRSKSRSSRIARRRVRSISLSISRCHQIDREGH
jgi:uncharacterized protein YdhG (YjbR/CyaY superfamily)